MFRLSVLESAGWWNRSPSKGLRGLTAESRRSRKWAFLPFLLASWGISCASRPHRPVPAWVGSPPSDAEYYYVVGVCQSALFEKDKENLALADARDKLASILETRIESETKIDDQDGIRRGSHRAKAKSEALVTGTEHLDAVERVADQVHLRQFVRRYPIVANYGADNQQPLLGFCRQTDVLQYHYIT